MADTGKPLFRVTVVDPGGDHIAKTYLLQAPNVDWASKQAVRCATEDKFAAPRVDVVERIGTLDRPRPPRRQKARR